MPCVGASPRGRACASICNTCPTSSAPLKSLSILTRCRTIGPASTIRSGSAEDLPDLVRRCNLELGVGAILRLFVSTPPEKDGGMAEPVTLHVVVSHLAHAFEADRLPGEILSGAPTALSARHPGLRLIVHLCPVFPRVGIERVLAERLELLRQLAPARQGKS